MARFEREAQMLAALNHPTSRLRVREPFVTTRFLNVEPAFSPDGRWIAYMSNESGRSEVYVRPFGGQSGRWQISTGGGNHPVWARQGKELFFESTAGIMAAPYSVGATFVPGNPRLWAAIHPSIRGGRYGFDVAADGKRLVYLRRPEETGGQKPLSSVTFLLNFVDELRRRTTSAQVEE